MKRFISILTHLLVFSFLAIAQDYSFYEDRRIGLPKRPDKFAVILIKANQDKYYVEQTLRSRINLQRNLKEIAENFYLINFTSLISEVEIDIQINSLQTLNELVKFPFLNDIALI